jgi:hypothetical protein
MVIMTEKENIPAAPDAPTDKRLPKAAVDFVETLLDVQRRRFEQELAARSVAAKPDDSAPVPSPSPSLWPSLWPSLPRSLQLLAESDGFVGSGWSSLDHSRSGQARRWMGRVGTLLFAADTTEGGRLSLKGGGFIKRAFVDELTVWLDDQPVSGHGVRRGINRWEFEGRTPALQRRPFHILRLQAPGARRFEPGPDGRGSLAVSEIRFTAG